MYVPAGADAVVARLNVEVPAPLTEAGLKLAVVPAGRTLALKATVPVKPFSAPTVAV
jgi:hypothetical protein